MRGQCEHCCNPKKEHWKTKCMYKGACHVHGVFVDICFEPPCATDAFEMEQRILATGTGFLAFCGSVAAFGLLVLLFVAVKKF